MKTRSIFVRLLPLLLALLLLGGCVPANSAPSAAAEPEIVTPEPSAEALPELTLLTPTPESAEDKETAAPTDTPAPTAQPTAAPKPTATPLSVDEHGSYDSRDEVALYIHLYGHLPENYITKTKAKKLGWPGGSLEPYAPGKCIGGGEYLNKEGLLPSAPGRRYFECDIDTMGRSKRGVKRIVFSNDGLIYYSGDHYESFTLLYGEE